MISEKRIKTRVSLSTTSVRRVEGIYFESIYLINYQRKSRCIDLYIYARALTQKR